MAWYVARWSSLFAVTFALASGSGSPGLVQLAGALLFLPLLAGGLAGGRRARRGDPWQLLLGTLAALCWLSAGMTALGASGLLAEWMLFPFILLAGIGQLVNFTAHREVIFDVVGYRRAPQALVVEAFQITTSMAVGKVLAGALLEIGGATAAFGGLLALHAAGLFGLRRARAAAGPAPAPPVQLAPVESRSWWHASAELVRRHRQLRFALAVTVAMNTFVYGYISLVPLLLSRFDSSALTISLLASGDGLGQIAAGLCFTVAGIRRHDRVLTWGAITTGAAIFGFALAPSPALAFAALVVAGIGTSGYAATQTAVALRDVDPASRPAVLGLVSIAIGATPAGMLATGALASVIEARTALALSAGIGLALVLAILAAGRATRPSPLP